ncbi:MAG: coenzyme F420-0:L-glutamate ligase [Bacillota bacterium]
MEGFRPNQGKKLLITVDGAAYARLPVKTHVVNPQDNLFDLFEKYLLPHLRKGDIVFISEKIVAITQGRAFPIKSINPSPLANFLVRFVHKSPYGIGLGSPWTMELAIREAGPFMIIFAAFCAAITKPLGIKGIFYRICGKRIAAIDGPCAYTLPPYNEYAKLGPARPDKVAGLLKEKFGHEVVIVDANDLGVSILGRSGKTVPERLARELFRDNPLGQAREQTPLCIVRKTADLESYSEVAAVKNGSRA